MMPYVQNLEYTYLFSSVLFEILREKKSAFFVDMHVWPQMSHGCVCMRVCDGPVVTWIEKGPKLSLLT